MKTENLHRHVCFITGKGMSEGFLMNDETYRGRPDNDQDIEDFAKEVRKLIPCFNADINIGYSEGYFGDDAMGGALIPLTISNEDLLEHSYEEENHLWTEWYQDDLEEEGEGYDDDGNLYEFEPLNKEWIRAFELSDYDIVAGDRVTTEVWEHKITKKLVTIPIEIVRDFDNIKYNN